MMFSLPNALVTAGVNDTSGFIPAMFDWPERMNRCLPPAIVMAGVKVSSIHTAAVINFIRFT